MSKGGQTREAILESALDLASALGLEGLSIGLLARETGMSKSGLYAHFGSKETLQVDTLRLAADRFTRGVIEAARTVPSGAQRLDRLFDLWLAWSDESGNRGGCIFVAASFELDDQPGPVRDYLVAVQREWLDYLAHQAGRAVAKGEFLRTVDPQHFAFDMQAAFFGYTFHRRLLGDRLAPEHVRRAYQDLMLRSRA